MKKKFLVALIFMMFFLSNTWALYVTWTPSENENYTFTGAFIQGQDFNLVMKQEVLTNYTCGIYYILSEIWGEYGNASTWEEVTGSSDANLFGGPIGSGPGETCSIKYFLKNNEYGNPPKNSMHKTTMTLNCSAGNYYIPTKFQLYCPDTGKPADWQPVSPKELKFTVLPAINMPPFYDYNLFWSRVTPETTPVPPEYYSPPFTQTHYIHAWDLNEHQAGGQYYIKKFEIQLGQDCEIQLGGTPAGAKTLDKTANVGT